MQKEISQAVTRALRKGKKIDTTFALRDLIAEALDFLPKDEKKEAIKNPAPAPSRHCGSM